MRFLHQNSGGETDGTQKIFFMTMVKKNLTPIKLKAWDSQTVCGYLEAILGGKLVNIVTSCPIRDRLC